MLLTCLPEERAGRATLGTDVFANEVAGLAAFTRHPAAVLQAPNMISMMAG